MLPSPAEESTVVTNAFMVVSQNMHDWLTHGLAESSIRMYRRDIAAYQCFAEQRALDVMNPQTLRLWRDWMLSQTRMSSNTINRMLAAVKRIMQEARQRDLLDELSHARFQGVEGVRIDPNRLKPHARTRISAADMR